MSSCALNGERIVCQRWNVHFVVDARRGNWPWPITNYCFTFNQQLSDHMPKSWISVWYLQSLWKQMESRWSCIGKTRKMAPHQKQEMSRGGQIQTPQAAKPPLRCRCVSVCVHTQTHTPQSHVIYLFLNSLTSYWHWQCSSFSLHVEEKKGWK